MRAPFNYLGGKARIAPWIASLLPAHRTYVEPFCGSAAVLFAKPPSLTEIINDRCGNVVTFFRVLRDRPAELERACRLTPYARDELAAADLDEPGLPDLERARRFFVRVQSSVSHSTMRTGFAIAAQAPPRSGSPDHAHKFVSLVARFEACAERLRTVQVENSPALDLIARYGTDPHVAMYCDPPYLRETRSMDTKRPTAGDYAHEMATPTEHRELLAALRGCRAGVLLSGYPSGLYEELLTGWWRVQRNVPVPTGNGTGKKIKRATEVVWSNRPLAVQGALSFAAAAEEA